MSKLDPTGTKTSQLEFADLQVFRVFSGALLVGVTRRLALITRPSDLSGNATYQELSGTDDLPRS
jgi:hypothetical protein